MSCDVIYNIGFLFKDSQLKEYLEKLSQKYGENLNSEYILGVNSLPHITLLQVDLEQNEIIKALNKNNFLGKKFSFSLSDFYIDKSSNGNSWYGIKANLSDELIEFQKNVYNSLGKPLIKNKLGSYYNPHITLGFIEDKKEELLMLLEEELKYRKIKGYLSLGISGKNYQFEKDISSSE